MKSLFTLYSLWATETGSAVKEMGQIAHKNIRTITFLLMALTMLWVAPASAQGVTGMLDGFSDAIKAGVDFLVLLALLVGVGAILFGLKLVVDKSNDRADVKNSHIAASLIGGSFLCMIWFVITVLVETAGGSSGDIGAAAAY